MAQQPDAFRDFGLLPQKGAPPSPETVRCFLSRGRIIGQFVGTGLVSTVGLGLAVPLALFLPSPLNVLGCAAVLTSFGAFVYLATHNDYRWVELDGTTLRAKHLYTGRVIERPLEEVESLATMVHPIRRPETVVIESLLGRVKGIEVRFRDRRTPLRIMRADPAMTNAREVIEAILFRMAQIREVDAEVMNFAGKPLVRHVFWKGERPAAQSGKVWKLSLCCLMLIGLLFGTINGLWGGQEQRLQALGSVPPQVIALQTLIENGPGANPHVTVTDFQCGGYVFESRGGAWSKIWVALFPKGKGGQPPGKPAAGQKEIRAILESKTIPNEAALKRLAQQGRVTGLCSDAPRSNFGLTLGPKLTEMNPGSRLSAAWDIEELSEPPGEAKVRGILLGSAACFALVILLALVVFKLP